MADKIFNGSAEDWDAMLRGETPRQNSSGAGDRVFTGSQEEWDAKLKSSQSLPPYGQSLEFMDGYIDGKSDPNYLAQLQSELTDPNTSEYRRRYVTLELADRADRDAMNEKIQYGSSWNPFDGEVGMNRGKLWLDRANNVLNQGALMGFGDELGSIANTARGLGEGDSWSERYRDNKRQLNEGQAAYEEANPWEAAAGKVAGGFLTSRGMGMSAAAQVPAYAKTGATAKGLIEGSALGALSGFGTGDERGGRFSSALTDGVAGGALGAALPLVTSGVGRAIEGPVARMIRNQNADPREISQALKLQGDSAMLLDDPRFSNISQAFVEMGDSPQRAQFMQAVANRQQSLPNEARAIIGNNTGAPIDFSEELLRVQKDLKEKARPLYEAADAAPALGDEGLLSILNNPALQKQRGNVMGNLDLKAATDDAFKLSPHVKDGALTDSGYNVDRFSRALRDSADTNLNSIDSLNKERGNILNNIKSQLDSTILDKFPHLAKAREVYRGGKEIEDAMGKGRGALLTSVKPDVMRQEFKALSDSGKDAYRLGIRAAIQDAFDNSTNEVAKAANMFDKFGVFQKLSTAYGDDTAKAMTDQIKTLTNKMRVGNSILGGSQTAQRQAGRNSITGITERLFDSPVTANTLGIGAGVMTGNPLWALGGMAAAPVLKKAAVAVNDIRRGKIIDALTATGAKRDSLLEALMPKEKGLIKSILGYNPQASGAIINAVPKNKRR